MKNNTLISLYNFIIKWTCTTNHKQIGTLYLLLGGFSGLIGMLLSMVILYEISHEGGFFFKGNSHIVILYVITLAALCISIILIRPGLQNTTYMGSLVVSGLYSEILNFTNIGRNGRALTVLIFVKKIIKSAKTIKAKVIVSVGTALGATQIGSNTAENRIQQVSEALSRGPRARRIESLVSYYKVGNNGNNAPTILFDQPSSKGVQDGLVELQQFKPYLLDSPFKSRIKASDAFMKFMEYKPKNIDYSVTNLPYSLPVTNSTAAISHQIYGPVFNERIIVLKPQFASSVIEDFSEISEGVLTKSIIFMFTLVIVYIIFTYKKQVVLAFVFISIPVVGAFIYCQLQKFPEHYDTVIDNFAILFNGLSTTPLVNNIDVIIKTKYILTELATSIPYWDYSLLSVEETYRGLRTAYYLWSVLSLSNSDWLEFISISQQLQLLEGSSEIIEILAKTKHGIKVLI